MRIDVLTIFPDLVEGFASASLLGKARERGDLGGGTKPRGPAPRPAPEARDRRIAELERENA